MGSIKGDHLWKEGQSGNPAGRPPGARSVETLFRDAIAKIAKDNPEVKDVERELIITLLAKAKKGDMRALEMYLDRLYGKPQQKIAHSGGLEITSIDIIDGKTPI